LKHNPSSTSRIIAEKQTKPKETNKRNKNKRNKQKKQTKETKTKETNKRNKNKRNKNKRNKNKRNKNKRKRNKNNNKTRNWGKANTFLPNFSLFLSRLCFFILIVRNDRTEQIKGNDEIGKTLIECWTNTLNFRSCQCAPISFSSSFEEKERREERGERERE